MTHNNNHSNHTPDLHLQDDPALMETQSLLESLAQHDRASMPTGLESRVLDSVAHTFAPAPISIVPVDQSAGSEDIPYQSERFSSKVWSLRIAAAAVLATGTTLMIVGAQPWQSSSHTDNPSAAEISLASFEQDLEDYFALETIDDGNLSEAVTDWEIWAQSVDTEIDSTLLELEWAETIYDDGAL